MTHRDFLKRESGLFDIPTSVFGAPLSWVVDYKYPHDIKCPLGVFRPNVELHLVL